MNVSSSTLAPLRRPLWQASLLAAALAAGANAVLFLIASARGAFPPDVLLPRAGRPMTLEPIVVISAAAALGGGLVFAVLRRVTRHVVPVFVGLAALVLALSFVTPFQIEDAPVAMIVWLEVMHVVAAAVVVGVLLRAARS